MLSGCAGDERGDQAGRGNACAVVAPRGAQVGVACGFLHVTKGNACVERGGEERVPQRVGTDPFGDPGPAGDPPRRSTLRAGSGKLCVPLSARDCAVDCGLERTIRTALLDRRRCLSRSGGHRSAQSVLFMLRQIAGDSRAPVSIKERLPVDYTRLSMPLGEVIFTQRSIRRFRSDAIALDDIHLILEAAVKAPNGGNQQVARFLVVNDRAAIREFATLYHEAWWAKRHDEGFQQWEDLPRRFHPAARLADAIGDVPCIVFALALHNGPADSVIPAVQNLMLAARAIGIGSVPTTLHPSVMSRFREMFNIQDDTGFHLCIPLGYPQGNFGPNVRKSTAETTFLNRWGSPVPWE